MDHNGSAQWVQHRHQEEQQRVAQTLSYNQFDNKIWAHHCHQSEQEEQQPSSRTTSRKTTCTTIPLTSSPTWSRASAPQQVVQCLLKTFAVSSSTSRSPRSTSCLFVVHSSFHQRGDSDKIAAATRMHWTSTTVTTRCIHNLSSKSSSSAISSIQQWPGAQHQHGQQRSSTWVLFKLIAASDPTKRLIKEQFIDNVEEQFIDNVEEQFIDNQLNSKRGFQQKNHQEVHQAVHQDWAHQRAVFSSTPSTTRVQRNSSSGKVSSYREQIQQRVIDNNSFQGVWGNPWYASSAWSSNCPWETNVRIKRQTTHHLHGRFEKFRDQQRKGSRVTTSSTERRFRRGPTTVTSSAWAHQRRRERTTRERTTTTRSSARQLQMFIVRRRWPTRSGSTTHLWTTSIDKTQKDFSMVFVKSTTFKVGGFMNFTGLQLEFLENRRTWDNQRFQSFLRDC